MKEQMQEKRSYFSKVSDAFLQQLKGEEDITFNYAGEDTQFIRFNNSLARQATDVKQESIHLIFQKNGRSVQSTMPLCGDDQKDLTAFAQILNGCRRDCDELPPDPYQVPVENHGQSEDFHEGKTLRGGELIDSILSENQNYDFVGQYTGGQMYRANKNSKGQDHWFSTESSLVDYSLYTSNQKAVKGMYSTSSWDQAEFLEQIKSSAFQLEMLEKPGKKVAPGKYRSYFAPAATAELVDLLSWNGISYSAYKQGQCALTDLQNGKKELSQKVNLKEDFSLGLTAKFNDKGEVGADQLDLISSGKLNTFLISTKSSKEYSTTSNFAGTNEGLRSPVLSGGSLEQKNILNAIGTGLYISNLHYLNWSDLQTGRITGMTRYACFWVEGGEIVAPLAQDLRFDETLYHYWGEGLIDFTDFSHIGPHVSSYGHRSTGGNLVPGMLVEGFSYLL
jgi:predicted Zn-dependent protease